MKDPVIIWQKQEYERFGRVKIAVLVSLTLILDSRKTPTIKKFNHHMWVIPEAVNPFCYKAIKIAQLPATATINNEGQIDNTIVERYQKWIERFVKNAPSGKECLLISNSSHDYAALIPRTKKLTMMGTGMEYPFRWVIRPMIGEGEMWEDFQNIAFVETSASLWNIPIGIDANDYWTPILCTKQGLGFNHSLRRKGALWECLSDPYIGVDHHQMTEQEAWEFVNKKLLAKD